MSKVLTTWLGLPKGFEPHGFEAFLYLVVNTITEEQYIGKKVFWSKLRVKQKGKKRRKRVTKESNWRTYRSSSKELQKDIAKYGPEAFEFIVLKLCKSRAEVNYLEVREQFLKNVLFDKMPNGKFKYYNTNILGKYYRRLDWLDL